MTAPANWRGPSSNAAHLEQRARRLGATPLALTANEIAEYPRPHWSICLIGPGLTVLALLVLVAGFVWRMT